VNEQQLSLSSSFDTVARFLVQHYLRQDRFEALEIYSNQKESNTIIVEYSKQPHHLSRLPRSCSILLTISSIL
jgi:hypothetical protein